MAAEHFDVLIVGAGLSGIGAAHHVQAKHPERSVGILESRDTLGGTWDLFRYPGIRSDSDMYTLGFGFRPWKEAEAIADGPAILSYLHDTAEAYGIDKKIQYGLKVISANWSTPDAQWTVLAERTDSGERVEYTASFLLGCTGYYRYDEGFSPTFPGSDDFSGEIVHPQHWPTDLDYAGKRVVVIGSGATAVTLVPAMAGAAEHVTMLQRSPTYIVSQPKNDELAIKMARFLPDAIAYPAVRWKNVARQALSYQLARRRPEFFKGLLRKWATRQLPDGYDVGTHFAPSYAPWDQRLCVVPGGDLFKAIRNDDASIVTDRIETFTKEGIRLVSGHELKADLIITATGLNLLMLGGMELSVDGTPVDVPNTMVYKGMMLEGVPNFALAIGYTNASWTLKADLTGGYVNRLLTLMDKRGLRQCTPVSTDSTIEHEPFLDFAAGYVQRSAHTLPKQGSKAPWKLHQNYVLDLPTLRFGKIDDGTMQFSNPAAKSQAARPKASAAA